MNDTEMHDKIFSWDAITTWAVGLASLFIEELVTHPAGALLSIVGLMFTYHKFMTQRLVYKMKKREYEAILEEDVKIKSDDTRENI